jgi:hypothetical protein
LEAGPLKDVADWVEHYRDIWEHRLDRLDAYLRELQANDAAAEPEEIAGSGESERGQQRLSKD